MFDAYREIMNPIGGLKDVIDDRVLRMLMRSFYLGEHHELMMLRYNGVTNEFEKFRPFEEDKDNRPYFNPFCKEFRQDARCNSLCEHCDLQHARALAQRIVKAEVIQYRCHIGLIDCVYPIQLANRTSAVLFAGQRVPLWDEAGMRQLQARVRETAPARYDNLVTLLQEKYESTEEGLENLKEQLTELGETIQQVVNASYDAKHANAVQKAIEEVSEHLNDSDMKFNWAEPIEDVLAALESLLVQTPMIFLVRDRDTYVVKATSPLAAIQNTARFDATDFDFLAADQWVCVKHPTNEHTMLLKNLAPSGLTSKTEFKLYRFEKNADTEASLSCIMIVFRRLESFELELPKECCRLFAHHAHGGLFMEKLTFTGHSMKTPIQVALLKLWRANRLARHDVVQGQEIIDINDGVVHQLQKALADADLMEAAAREHLPTVDIASLLAEIIPHFSTLGEARRVTVVTRQPVDESLFVFGDESELRIVLSNLLDNAVKYSYAGKEVRVSAQRTSKAVEVSIANFGVGIDRQKRDHLFTYGGRVSVPEEKFARSGSGLGLAQAKQLVEKNRGTINVVFTPVNSDEQHGVVVAKVSLSTR